MQTKRKVILAALVAAVPLYPTLTPAGTVSTTADDGSSGSLRIVIQNAGNNELITFNPDVTGTLVLKSHHIDIWTNLTIQGPGGRFGACVSGRAFYAVTGKGGGN